MVTELAMRSSITLPSLLVGYQTPYHVGVREVGLPTLIGEFGAEGSSPVIERITLLWSASDRWYVLSACLEIRLVFSVLEWRPGRQARSI